MFNRIIALILFILLSPLFILIALIVKLDSSGPAIFKQRRVGQYGKYFNIYKFRTMVTGTPDLPASMVGETDARFTRTGKLLRRLSLDEIPQLINIIKGDMNFIGPRPALYNQYKLIEMRKKNGIEVLKPGVTGWAQVNGRDNISLERKVDLDKYYLENYSLKLDVKILLMTLMKSLVGADLYLKKSAAQSDQKSSSATYSE